MSMFKKLAKKMGLNFEKEVGENEKIFVQEEDKTKEINDQRSKLKESITANLQRIGFDEDDIYEVISVLNKAEFHIKVLKDELIGTNINNPHPDVILNEKLKEIRDLELQMAEDVRKKIAEIIKKKNKAKS